MAKRKRISFKKWINDVGHKELSRIFKVNRSTISRWGAGLYYPRVDQMRKIKEMTKGAVDYDMIIDGK